MPSTVGTTNKRKHFLTCLHNVLPPYAWRWEAPPILKRKGKGEKTKEIYQISKLLDKKIILLSGIR
jgi:hypothetical protein